jgi:histidinol-phosphate aminotransferase
MPTSTDCIERFLRTDIQNLHAYSVQPSTGMVKLDVMENPYALAPELQQELGQRLGQVALHRYPAERTQMLKQALAQHAHLPPQCELMLGNGSDELITLLTLAHAQPGAVILAPLPGFVMYEMSAQLQGVRFVGVPTTAEFELDLGAMLKAIAEHQPALIWLAYPNNPTANLWSDTDIDAIIEAAPGWVVMDEAYQPFAQRHSLDRLTRYENVLVMRTLSKFGLAGVRIGYVMGPSVFIHELEKLRPPFNVSSLNTEAALFALEHTAEYSRQAMLIRQERERLSSILEAWANVRVYPSQANMLLLRVGHPGAAAVYAGMRARGVLIKNVSGIHPLLSDCLRITIGTPEENTRMLLALEATLTAH